MNFCRLTVILVLAALAHPLSGEETGQPTIRFEQTEYSFGVISRNVPFLVHDFIFRNEGDGVLEILDTKDACNCFVSTISNKKVKPGEKGKIGVKLLVKHVLEVVSVADISRSIAVYTNDPVNAKVLLTVYVEVQRPFIVEPKVVRFEPIRQGKAAAEAFEILPQLEAVSSHRVIAIEPSVDFLDAKWQAVSPVTKFSTPTADLTPAQRKQALIEMLGKYNATVRLKPDAPEGEFTEFLTVGTNVPEQQIIEVAVHGDVIGKISVSPKRVFFGVIDAGDKSRRAVTISGVDKEFKIKRAEKTLDYIRIGTPHAIPEPDRIGSDDKGKYEIAIEVCPGKNTVGAFEDKIILHTDIAEKEKIEFSIYGVIRGSQGKE